MAAYLGGVVLQKTGVKVADGDTIVFGFNYNASNGVFAFWDSKNNSGESKTVPKKDFSLSSAVTLGSTTQASRYIKGMVGEVKVYDSFTQWTSEREAMVAKWITGLKITPESPADGGWAFEDTDLNWAFNSTAVSYDVYFGADANDVNDMFGSALVADDITVESVSYAALPTLVDGTTYYWKVIENGSATASDVYSFTWFAQSGLIQHLDAMVDASVIRDGSGVVSHWIDQSPAQNNTLGVVGTMLYPSTSLSASSQPGVDMGNARNAFKLHTAAEQDSWLNFTPTGGAKNRTGFAVLVAFKADSVLGGNIRDVVFANNGNAATSPSFGLKYEAGTMSFFANGTLYSKSGLQTVVAGDTIVYGFNYDAATGAYEFWDSKNASSKTGTLAARANFASVQSLWLGTSDNPGQYMNGMIGEVKVFNSVLSAEEFANEQDALVEKWVIPAGIAVESPADGGVVFEETDLSWTFSGTAVSYDVYFGADANDVNDMLGSVLVADDIIVESVAYTALPTLVDGTTYYWKVIENGSATASDVYSFTWFSQPGLIQHLDATVPGSVSGNPVTQWADQSGSAVAYDAIPAVGSVYYPSSSLSASGLGLAGLDFGDTLNSLELFTAGESDSWLNQVSGNGFCVLVAFKCDSLNTGDWNDLIGNSAAIASGFGLRYSKDGTMQTYLGGVMAQKNDGLKVAAGDTIVYGFNYNAGTGVYAFWDSKNSSAMNNTVPKGDFSLSSAVTLGSTTEASRYIKGMVGEVKVFNRVLSAEEFADEQDALVQKWNPGIDAGENKKIILPTDSVFLNGTVPVGAKTVAWSLADGPAAVSFDPNDAPNTTVTFTQAGDYLLRLTATDGFAATAQDDVLVKVRPTGFDGLEAHITFENADSNLAVDSAVGIGYEGTLYGDPNAGFAASDAKLGAGALELFNDATTKTDYVSYSKFLGSDPAMSVAVWFKCENLYADARIIEKWPSNTSGLGWFLRIRSGGNLAAMIGSAYGSGTYLLAPLDTLTENDWSHAVLTFDNGVMRLYQNGALVQEAAAVAYSPENIVTPTLLGRRLTTNNEWFDGLIDEVRIYDYALSVEEVKALYAGDGGLPWDTCPTAGLAGDLTQDCRVDMLDMAALGTGWQSTYNITALEAVAQDWLACDNLDLSECF
jgi:hypothetical protein